MYLCEKFSIVENFKALGIKDNFIKGLNELGIIEPTEIQQETIPFLLSGSFDMVGQAQTGTGKTAAYGLPLLHKIDASIPAVQGLILVPTRELAQQVQKQLFRFTKYTEKIFGEAVYGGSFIDKQIAALSRPTHIVVATPGRLIDLVKRKAVDLSAVQTIVLDEADEMLSRGFKDELDEILDRLTNAKCTWLFSATMPHGIKQIVNEHLAKDAKRITIKGGGIVNKNISHRYIVSEDRDKLYRLVQLLKTEYEGARGIIFCNTKKNTQLLCKQLIAQNFTVDAIHGDLLQKERDKVMRAFKKERVQLLVATDIAARGLDIPELSFVIHFQLPDKDEFYTHRSGRTARAGKEGISLSMVNGMELRKLKHLERTLGIQLKEVV